MSNRFERGWLRTLCLVLMPWVFLFGWASARAQPVVSLTDTWSLNVGSTSAFMQLDEDDEGRLRGTLQGRPLTGLHVARDGFVAFVVGSLGDPSHLFYGARGASGGHDRMWGVVVNLRPGQTHFGSSLSNFSWEARRGVGAVPWPSNITKSGLPSTWVDVSGLHEASAPKATIRLQQGADGNLVGSWNGAEVQGHFERPSGVLGAVRLVNGLPTEAMVSNRVDDPQSGFLLLALSPEALQRMGGVGYRRWDLGLRGAGNLSGRWQINGNGWPGTLNLTQDTDGRISGTLYGGEPVQGFYSRSERRMVLLRGPLQRPIQAYVGEVSADGEHWQGRFYSLDTGASGGSFGNNVFAFAAQRYAAAPLALPPLVATQGTAPRLPRMFRFFNRPAELRNTQSGWLDFAAITGVNEFNGTLFGDPIFGHFVVSSGVLAMVRSRGGEPIQFYVGQAQRWPRQPEADVPRFEGQFYALTAEGGAAPDRMTYGWSANAVVCGIECPPY